METETPMTELELCLEQEIEWINEEKMMQERFYGIDEE